MIKRVNLQILGLAIKPRIGSGDYGIEFKINDLVVGLNEDFGFMIRFCQIELWELVGIRFW